MVRILDRTVGLFADDFFKEIPEDAYISEDRVVETFLNSFLKDAAQVEKEMETGDFQKASLFCNFVRRELYKDLKEHAEKHGGITRNDVEEACNRIIAEFKEKTFVQLAQEAPSKNKLLEELSKLLPGPSMIVGNDTDIDQMALSIGLQTLKHRAFLSFGSNYVAEHNLKPAMFSTIVKGIAGRDLMEHYRHSKFEVGNSSDDFHGYINYKCALENAWSFKDITAVGMVLQKIATYYAMVYSDLSDVDFLHITKTSRNSKDDALVAQLHQELEEKRKHGPYSKELALINGFIGSLLDKSPEELTPGALDRSFMKTLRDGLTSQEYNFLTTEFSKREKQILNERIAEGHDVPRNYTQTR